MNETEPEIRYLKQTDGEKIAYRKRAALASHKDFPAIMFCGGFCSDMEGSKALALDEYAAKNGLEYLRFDYRGHGQSGGDFAKFSIADWRDDAKLVLGQIDAQKVILIGSSMGGWIAHLLARDDHARIGALIGIAAAPDFTEDSFFASFDENERAIIEKGGIVERPSGYEMPYQISAELIEGSRKVMVLRSALKLEMPVRLFQGQNDEAVSEQTALQLFHHIDCEDLSLEFVAHADHSFSRPQDLSRIFRALDQLIENKR